MTDENNRDALAMIEAFAAGNRDILSRMIADFEPSELRRITVRLLGLFDLRLKVGTDMPNTAEWARWLRANYPDTRRGEDGGGSDD